MLSQYGCTATVLYKMYKQSNFEIDRKLAVLMLSAIISDTLLFKSPTCTDEDKTAASQLNKIANLNLEEYGLQMLKAGTDLSDVTEEELINLDAKEFVIGDLKTVVAQVNTASIPDMMERKLKIEEAIKAEISKKGLDLFFFGKTDIVERSYNVKLENNTAFLPGVVSRKKQIIPVLTENA